MNDPPLLGLRFCTYKTFYSVLKRLKIKIFQELVPSVCPICSILPEINKEIELLRRGDVKHEDPERRLAVLVRKRSDIFLHEAQLQVQRAEITKIREDLKYRQCLVFQDFIGHYIANSRGL